MSSGPSLVDIVVEAANLKDRFVLDEESGEIDGLIKKTTAVVAKIKNDTDNPFPLEPLMSFLTSLVVFLVETREGDETDLFDSATGQFVLDDVSLGEAVLDADHVALKDDVLMERRSRAEPARKGRTRWTMVPFLPRIMSTTLLSSRVDGVDGFGTVLADGDDAVAGLKALVEIGGDGEDVLFDGSITVIVGAKDGANACDGTMRSMDWMVKFSASSGGK